MIWLNMPSHLTISKTQLIFLGNNMKILAIDDEELSQNFIQQVLGEEHDLQLASNGEQGIQLATEINPDLILLDVNMPGMDGYVVCEKLKTERATADIPVLFLSRPPPIGRWKEQCFPPRFRPRPFLQIQTERFDPGPP